MYVVSIYKYCPVPWEVEAQLSRQPRSEKGLGMDEGQRAPASRTRSIVVQDQHERLDSEPRYEGYGIDAREICRMRGNPVPYDTVQRRCRGLSWHVNLCVSCPVRPVPRTSCTSGTYVVPPLRVAFRRTEQSPTMPGRGDGRDDGAGSREVPGPHQRSIKYEVRLNIMHR